MAVIKLKIDVADVANVLLLYDRLRVYRSTEGELGPFEPITDLVAQPATLTGSLSAPFDIFGLTFSLAVNTALPQTVTFVTPNPVSVDMALAELADGITGIVAGESAGAVVLSTVTTGTASLLEVTDGSAVTPLGFELGWVSGKDEHITLQSGQTRYEYDDQSGDPSYWYRTQYYNSATGAQSTFSAAVQGALGAVISSSLLIMGQVRLADLSGKPLPNQKIVAKICSGYPSIVETYGIFGHSIEATTDAAGYAELPLIKGAVVDVVFVGTSLVRRITVPTTGSTFDLFSAVSQADDNFQLRVPTVSDAIRRSL